jgi:hypothetical protein
VAGVAGTIDLEGGAITALRLNSQVPRGLEKAVDGAPMNIGSGTPRDLVKDDVSRKLTEAGIDVFA